jgi:cytoskeletal protein RodZ
VSSHADFGRYLKDQRELKGLSRDDVSKATRIPPTLVAALEDGHAERLPEHVFVINYIKSYAQVVGLSADEVITRYFLIPGTMQPTEKSPVAREAERRKNAWLGMAAFLLALALAGGALWWWTATAR